MLTQIRICATVIDTLKTFTNVSSLISHQLFISVLRRPSNFSTRDPLSSLMHTCIIISISKGNMSNRSYSSPKEEVDNGISGSDSSSDDHLDLQFYNCNKRPPQKVCPF